MTQGPTILIDIDGEWENGGEGYRAGLGVTRFNDHVYFNVDSYGHDHGKAIDLAEWRKLIESEAIALGLIDKPPVTYVVTEHMLRED